MGRNKKNTPVLGLLGSAVSDMDKQRAKPAQPGGCWRRGFHISLSLLHFSMPGLAGPLNLAQFEQKEFCKVNDKFFNVFEYYCLDLCDNLSP